jgi:hypothetical protein
MNQQPELSSLHYEIIRNLIEKGICPTNSSLAERLSVSEARIEELLRALSDIHGVVLHPHESRPWIVHPFSITPTMHSIQCEGRIWWAPCVWCALGVATLVGGEVRIHTRLGAETESFTILVRNGDVISPEEIVVHFAIPPACAWNNVHEHCSMVLAFRSVDDIKDWCLRHGLPFGEPVKLCQVANLANHWYGSHANPNWQKWTVSEAQEIFHRAGLRSEFWDLRAKSGRF